MIEWLADTLVMTGALMGLVLMVRRPVARWFGPTAAYALWALPMIRLILPPLALPRGLIPHISFAAEPAVSVVEPMAVPVSAASDMAAGSSLASTVSSAVPPPVAEPLTAMPAADPGLLAHVPWMALLLTVWLGGAAFFLVRRFWNYHLMRREILADARLVARSGDVKIFESPVIAAPLAFGVFEKFVALPQGFLAGVDSESSDFAIAHELEHHAGNDLLAIMALQPLFALHWFNPIGWAAWRALRADQEAACDARVMVGCGREMRARYGRLIASFAAPTRLTLAAPMAGTLAGEKPIIQRLKALGRAEVSPARKVAARSLFALAIVSVPLTATVTYAAMEKPDEVPEAPEAPAAPMAAQAPAVPAVPAAPVASAIHAVDPDSPDAAPAAPQAPEPPAAPTWVAAAPVPPVPPAPPVPPVPPAPNAGRGTVSISRTITRDVDATVTEAMRNVPEVRQTSSSDGRVQTIRITRKDANGQVRIDREMTLDSRCPADSNQKDRHAKSVVICTGTPKAAMEAATRAISAARVAVAANRNLTADVRAEVMADLDAEMAKAQAEAARANSEGD